MYYYIDQARVAMEEELNIKPLTYGGVAPSTETIMSQEYPPATNYYAVMQRDTPAEHPARKLANWLLTAKGQDLVDNSGLGAITGLGK